MGYRFEGNITRFEIDFAAALGDKGSWNGRFILFEVVVFMDRSVIDE